MGLRDIKRDFRLARSRAPESGQPLPFQLSSATRFGAEKVWPVSALTATVMS